MYLYFIVSAFPSRLDWRLVLIFDAPVQGRGWTGRDPLTALNFRKRFTLFCISFALEIVFVFFYLYLYKLIDESHSLYFFSSFCICILCSCSIFNYLGDYWGVVQYNYLRKIPDDEILWKVWFQTFGDNGFVQNIQEMGQSTQFSRTCKNIGKQKS